MNSVLVGIIVYVLAQFALGAWISRKMTSEQDYILAGRQLGGTLVAFSVFATFFGAEAIVASTASIHEHGLSGALVDPIAYGLALLIVGVLFAARLRSRELVTFADFFRERFSPEVERLVVFMLLPGSLFWAAAQIRAFGQVLNANAGVGLGSAILLAGVLVAVYAVVGGLLADAVTDFLQGLVVLAGLLVLAIAVAGQTSGLWFGLDGVPAERLVLLQPDETGWLGIFEKVAIAVCGTIVAVEVISRFLGARSASIAAAGTVWGAGLYLMAGLVPMYLGLVGGSVLPDLREAEEIVPRLAEATLPLPAYIIFIGAIISAILSVVHATLHAPAAQISHNVVLRVRPQAQASTRLWTVRLTVAGLSAVACFLATTSDGIKELVETASAFGSAGVLVATVFGLFTKFGGGPSAYAAIVSGTAMWAWGKYVFALNTPYLVSIAFAVAVYVTFAVIEKRDPSQREG